MNEMPAWGRGALPSDSTPQKPSQPENITPVPSPDSGPQEKIEGRFGRNPKPLPTAGEKIAKAADEIGDAIGDTASAAAQKASDAFSSAAETVSSTAGEVKKQWLSKKQKVYATGIAGVAATAFFGSWLLFKDYVSLDKTILRRDANAAEKCFSQYGRSKLKSADAENKKNKAIDLMHLFGQRGTASAKDLASSEYTFCFGIDQGDVAPKAHWPKYEAYFVNSNYPIELAAVYYGAEDKDMFWTSKIERPVHYDGGESTSTLNHYVPESALIFHRMGRAVPAVEDIRNMYNALYETRSHADNADSKQWAAFLSERPNLKNTLAAYIDVMKDGKNERRAMEAATMAYLSDPAALEAGDKAFLESYKTHVALYKETRSANIYYRRGEGRTYEYAFVDADRDGNRDDLIRFANYQNQADEYFMDYGTSKSGFYNKQELVLKSGTRTGADGKPESYTYTEWEDVSERVRFDIIPAARTASVHLAPETLAVMTALSETDYLSADGASKIARDFSLAKVYGTNVALMDEIKRLQAANIPQWRDKGEEVAGLGLKR